MDKLRIYEKLGVDEVWIWRKGAIEVYVLAGERFKRVQGNRVLPTSTWSFSPPCSAGTRTQAVRDFRKALEAESR